MSEEIQVVQVGAAGAALAQASAALALQYKNDTATLKGQVDTAKAAVDVAKGQVDTAKGAVDASQADVIARQAVVVAAQATTEGARDTAVTQAGVATTKAAEAAGNAALALAIFGTADNLNAAQQIMLGYATTAQGAASQAQASAASAASVAQQDLSGVTAQAIHRSPANIVGAFFYDTAKDSDPHWPDRVTNTSWFNEALNGNYLPFVSTHGWISELDARAYKATLGANINMDPSFSGPTGWTNSPGVTQGSGKMTFTNVAAGLNGYRTDTGTLSSAYQVTVIVDSINSGGMVQVILGNATNVGPNITAPGTYTFTVPPNASTPVLGLRSGASNTTAVISKLDAKPVTAFTTKNGDYYQLNTDGKHYRLSVNLFKQSVFPGLGGPGTAVTGWAPTGTQGWNPVAVAQESVNGVTTGVVKLRRIGATGLEGLQQTTTTPLFTMAHGLRVLVRVPTGVTAAALVHYDGVGPFVIASAATLNAQAKDVWVEYVVSHTPSALRTFLALGLVDAAIGTGCDIACPQLQHGAFTAYDATGDQLTYRGNKAKFPRQSLTVYEADNITIYDLTEPGFPMWMRFRSDTGGMIIRGVSPIGSVVLVNGEMLVGINASSGDLHRINFIKDRGYTVGSFAVYEFAGNIAQRNTALGSVTINTTTSTSAPIFLMSRQITMLAAYVYPDAPVDPATGMQVPTILVATPSGMNTIRHDGVIVADTSSQASVICTLVAFLPDGRAVRSWNNDGRRLGVYNKGLCPSASSSSTADWNFYTDSVAAGGVPYPATAQTLFAPTPMGKRGRFATIGGGSGGFTMWVDNLSAKSASLIASITSTFNTGWMTGDTRRCWMSEVVAGALAAADFAAASYATPAANDNVTSVVSATAFNQTAGTTMGRTYLNITTVPGRSYTLQCTVTTDDGVGCLAYGRAGYNGGGTVLAVSNSVVGTGFQTVSFVATGTQSSILWSTNSTGKVVSATGIKVLQSIADVSYKGQALAVAGTLSLTAVAAAAQLCYVRGFSNSNYLYAPYHADFDPGTGAWALSTYVDVPSSMVGYEACFPELTANLAANGDFSGGTASWTNGIGTPTFSVSSGVASLTNGSAAESGVYQDVLTVGRIYKSSVNRVSQIGGATGAFALGTTKVSLTQNGAQTFFAQCLTTNRFQVQTNTPNNGGGMTFDDVSVKEVGPCVLFDRAAASGARIQLAMDATGRFIATAYDGTTTRTCTTTQTWLGFKGRIEVLYASGTILILVNGDQVASATGAALLTLNNASATVTVGNSRDLNAAFPGGLALMKWGATVGSNSAIPKWTYAQEVLMFQPGAQVALMDGGAAISAAYDPDTDALSVNTAAYECVYVGLVRVAANAAPLGGSYTVIARGGGAKAIGRATVAPGVDITRPSLNLREQIARRAEESRRQRADRRYDDIDMISGQTTITLPADWTPDQVMTAGVAKREGSTKDYTVAFDGFNDSVVYAVAPGAGAWVRVWRRRAQ